MPNIGAQEDAAYINSIATAAKPNALSLQSNVSATSADATLQAVLCSLRSGQWQPSHPTIRQYFTLRHELLESDVVLLHNDHLVIPSALRQRMLKLMHAGHQRIIRTKQRLTNKVWWPNMVTEAKILCY